MSRKLIERGAIETWKAGGYECAIRPGGMCLNGYVRLPENHPFRDKGYDDIPVEVHGGLTYGADEEGWVGFDTAHSGDWWPEEEIGEDYPDMEHFRKVREIIHRYPSDTDWTRERLRQETNNLALQLRAIARTASKDGSAHAG